MPPPPGTTGSCARLFSSYGAEGPAVLLANPTSNDSPCEASDAPTPEETFAVVGGALRVGNGLCAAGRHGAPTPFGPLQLWAKPLAGGAAAVVLVNRGDAAAPPTSVALADVPGLDGEAASFAVRDAFAHADLPDVAAGGALSLTAPPRGGVFIILTPH